VPPSNHATTTLELRVEVRVDPSKGERFLEVFAACRAATLLEPGCRRYALYRSQEEPTSFVLLEQWASPRALLDHFATDHFKEYIRLGETEQLLAAPTTVVLAGQRMDSSELAEQVRQLVAG